MGAGAAARARAEQVARTELAERVAAFRAVAPRVSPSGRTVIVVDDGVATGATLKAALRAIASLGPARLVVALPGGPADTLSEIGEMPGVDELVVLTVPRDFYAVGQLYDRFEQVATQAVCDALERNRSRARSLPAGGRAESSRSGEAPR
jgi:putative phosphoribosyl transferase